jgi:DNA-binding LytR/AlgR family response regulator
VSSPYKVAIVEDDPEARKLLSDYLFRFEKEFGFSFSISAFDNPLPLLDEKPQGFDIVLMDIELPHMTGMELAAKMRKYDSDFCLIFVTNMAQYAVQGYEVDAMGFIVKPASYFQLAVLLKKAIRRADVAKDSQITVHCGDEIVWLSLSDITYIEVYDHFLIYHTLTKTYQVGGQLGPLEEKLKAKNFFRISKSDLVNMKYVIEIHNSSLKIGGETLLISRRRKNDFVEAMNRYLGGDI